MVARLGGFHHGVESLLKVRSAVPASRRVAAANVPADQAHPELNPFPTQFQTLFTTIRSRRHRPNLIQMSAFTHSSSSITSRNSGAGRSVISTMPPNPHTPLHDNSIPGKLMRRLLGSMSVFTLVMTVPQILTIW